MRYSKQREFIFKALQDNPCHPTAERLYALIKPVNPAISLGTVYRNLNQMAEQGRIKKIKGLNQSDHFDHFTQEHAHIICEVCGKVEDIFIDPTLLVKLDVKAQNSDFKINNREIIFSGVCGNCRNKQEN